jgi:hypothetical protein
LTLSAVSVALGLGLDHLVLVPLGVPYGARLFCCAVLGLGIGLIWLGRGPKRGTPS